MAALDVYGIGHALVDVKIPVADRFFSDLGFPKGQRLAITAEQQNKIIKASQIDEARAETALGGSVTQTLAVISRLSGKTAFSGRIGKDELGEVFKRELGKLNIYFAGSPAGEISTGRAVLLAGPDGTQSTAAFLGASKDFSPLDLAPAAMRQVKWICIEGYLFENGRMAQDAIFSAIKYVQRLAPIERPKICLSLGSRYLVKEHREDFIKALADCDLVFGRMREAMVLTEAATPSAAFERLQRLVPNFVITAGKEGTYFSYNKEYGHIPCPGLSASETTDASEVFAGAFLYGIINGRTAQESVRGAVHLAALEAQQKGFYLNGDIRRAWQEGVQK